MITTTDQPDDDRQHRPRPKGFGCTAEVEYRLQHEERRHERQYDRDDGNIPRR